MEMTAIEFASAQPIAARFTVDAKPLADALAFMTGKIIERRNTVPILSNVVLVAWPGRVDLLANDLDIMARIAIPADTIAPGAFTLDASALQAIAKKAGAGARLEFLQDDGRAIIDTGASKARLPMLPADDFPLPAPIGADCHRFPLSAEFVRDLASVAPFVSKQESRYYICGTSLQRRELAGRDRLLIAATDSSELAAWSRPIPQGAESLPDVILPAKLVKALQGAHKLAGGGDLSAEFDRRGLVASIECGAVFLQSKLIDGTFPDIEQMAVASIGDAPAQALLIPELDPEMNPATLERMAKATGAALSWENVGGYLLASDPANPDWFGMACKGGMPKGYSVDYAQGEQSAARYLVDLAKRRGLDAGAPDTRALVRTGGIVNGMTVGARVYVPAAVEYVQDWQTLTMRKVETPARHEYAEGAYSIPMPRERQTLEAACSLTVDGQTYPLATNSAGNIHLSKDAVRKIIGESCFETMAVTLPDGRAAFILQWLWDDGVTRFCTVRADGRCATGKAGDGTAGIMITRAEIERGAVQPIAAMESPAPIDEPAPEILAAEHRQPESATDESPEPVTVSGGPILPPVANIPADDALSARIDALEQAVAALQAVQGAPVAVADKPRRSPAHERAIRRAWAERKARREAQAECERWASLQHKTWETLQGHRMARRANARRALSYRANMRAMRQTADQANAGLAQAIGERNAARAELASLKRSLADPSNPMRADDTARLIDDARAARARAAMLEQQNAQMKAITERGADQLDAMISRVTRAEAALRKAGLLSAPLAIVAPDQVAA